MQLKKSFLNIERERVYQFFRLKYTRSPKNLGCFHFGSLHFKSFIWDLNVFPFSYYSLRFKLFILALNV